METTYPIVMHTFSQNKHQTQRIQNLSLTRDSDQKYFLYLPNVDLSKAPVLVCVHGTSRNAKEHAHSFMELAESHGVIIVAPLFDAKRFSSYQRLGRAEHGQRADLQLKEILKETRELFNINTQNIYLFGYSGGAQFAHRYMMAYPEQINALVIASAGWYTFPDMEYRYPRGIARSDKFTGSHFNAEEFLRVPVCVLVGEHDVLRDATLRSTARLEYQQGLTRRVRAVNWINAMRVAAQRFDYDTTFYFELLPETGHSYTTAMTTGEMGRRAFNFLFSSPSSRDRFKD